MNEPHHGGCSGNTVTLRLTDLVDSAALAERLGDASMGLIGDAHDRMARAMLIARAARAGETLSALRPRRFIAYRPYKPDSAMGSPSFDGPPLGLAALARLSNTHRGMAATLSKKAGMNHQMGGTSAPQFLLPAVCRAHSLCGSHGLD